MLSAAKRILLTAQLACFRLTTRQRWAFGVCAVFKDESRHLEEWLEFHRLMGVEHFFLYNDHSTDGFMTVLQPWIDKGQVTLRPSKSREQKAIYNHCLRHGAARCRWIAFIDLDEFLFSPEAVPLPEAMERYSTVPAVFVHWILFGSGGHVHAPQGGTVDSYTKSMGLDASISDDFVHGKIGPRSEYVTGCARDGKSIVDPRAVIEMGVHLPYILKWGSTVTETLGKPHPRSPAGTPFTCDILRINHYWSRSVEELTVKVLRGAVRTSKREEINLERSLQRETLLNQVEDRVILDTRERLSASRR
ncbi:MAG: hypothetical protein RLZ37_1569 [Actinomycetota bacterium]